MLSRLTIISRHLAGSPLTTASMSTYPVFNAASNSSLLPKTHFIKFHSKGAARIIELDRPSALHALNLEMIEALITALTSWENNDNCKLVILKANAPSSTKTRAFCAGGDVVALLDEKLTLDEKSEFFRKEYSLNHLVGTFSKPIVSLIDGITMGGGVGISVHGQFRVASENTLFAMPETAIGFFPDVGGSFFLPRMEGGLGMYLALTGARLRGQDTYHAGIATHFVPSTRIPDLEESLIKAASNIDLNHLGAYIEQFSGELEPFTLQPLLPFINRCFSNAAPTIMEIVHRLESFKDHPLAGPWANETIFTFKKMSPTSLVTTLHLLQQGVGSTFRECLEREFNLAKNFLQYVPDMRTGITAKLITKSKEPVAWNPSTIEQVDSEFIKRLFAKNLTITSQINFLTESDYQDYPHVDNALPTMERIKALVEKNRTLTDSKPVLEAYCSQHYEKLGLRQKMREVFQRHVRTRADLERQGHSAMNGLNWIDDSKHH